MPLFGLILLGVAGVLIVFLALSALRKSAYHVERQLEIAAPADRVFSLLNDLHRFAGVLVLFGTPWEEQDPNMQATFGGPAAGVGQSYAWSSRKGLGEGRMTIVESVPGQKVGVRIEFEKPMKSTATSALTISSTPSGSNVTWAMDGNHNFIGKAFGTFMNMDNMLGGDIEKGLARLRSAAEGGR